MDLKVWILEDQDLNKHLSQLSKGSSIVRSLETRFFYFVNCFYKIRLSRVFIIFTTTINKLAIINKTK